MIFVYGLYLILINTLESKKKKNDFDRTQSHMQSR